jgi:hypothetical protein
MVTQWERQSSLNKIFHETYAKLNHCQLISVGWVIPKQLTTAHLEIPLIYVKTEPILVAVRSSCRSSDATLLGSRVRIPPGLWVFSLLCVVCCVCSGLCDKLIARLEGFYWLCLAIACDPGIPKRRSLGLIWAVALQEKLRRQNVYYCLSQKPIIYLLLHNGFSLRFQF